VPKVSPFTGLLFDQARVGPLERVTAPPYDMITASEERRFHAASPYNVVRLILGTPSGDDREADGQYTRAASSFRRWREEGILVPTPGPAWFPYELRFWLQGEPRRVRGVVCAVELEPWGGSVIPHERTLDAPIRDRLALLRSVQANLSAVYAVFPGPCPPFGNLLEEVSSTPPSREATDEEGVTHRLWVLQDGSSIPEWLRDETLLIADGHHRYATALAYQEEMRSRHGSGPWDRMMMLVVDAGAEDPPVLPIHRVVGRGRVEARGARVRDLGEVLATVRDDDLTYGMAIREDGDVIHRVARLTGQPPTVCALHDEVLTGLELRYTPDAVAAEEAVRTGAAPAAFFLPPTRFERIRAVIEGGGRLPEKSTYFWPKPRTGMVLRPLE
jgi:uncharacterized protein (DUF1015 family)